MHIPKACLALFCLFCAPAVTQADDIGNDSTWEINISQKTLFNSHTSYEFGYPLAPYHSPLSRLEFSLDSAWGGVEVRKRFSRFSIGAGFLTSVADQAAGLMKDTDWDAPGSATPVTNYSESLSRLEPSYQVAADIDLQIADVLRLPEGFDLRPMIGFRWQQLSFMVHDGVQYDYNPPPQPPDIQLLPGNSISFEQTWYQYVIGLKMGYTWKHIPWLHRLKAQAAFDWSYVEGSNRDRHLLRPGNRITEQQTSGDAWHTSLELLFGLTPTIELGVEADYLHITTTGTHTLRDDINFTVPFSWQNGVKVWSEQFGVSVRSRFRF